jgi:hypothetical protein
LLHVGGREAGQGRRSRKAKAKAAQAPEEKSRQNGQQEQQALEFLFFTQGLVFIHRTHPSAFSGRRSTTTTSNPINGATFFFASVYWGF